LRVTLNEIHYAELARVKVPFITVIEVLIDHDVHESLVLFRGRHQLLQAACGRAHLDEIWIINCRGGYQLGFRPVNEFTFFSDVCWLQWPYWQDSLVAFSPGADPLSSSDK